MILYFMPNNSLVGLSGNANDLLRFIQWKIATTEYGEDSRYYIYLNTEFKEKFNAFLIANGTESISIPTFNRAVKELKDKYVLLNTSTRGKVLYNFKDFTHVGNNEQFKFDIVKYKIVSVLDKVKNKK